MLHFSTGPTTRKGKNLARNAHCVIAVDSDDLHLAVEGKAAKVSDAARLRRVADTYASKYGWQVTVRDGASYAFDPGGAETAAAPRQSRERTPTRRARGGHLSRASGSISRGPPARERSETL